EPALAQLRAAADGLVDLAHDPDDRFEHVKELGRALDNLGAALLRYGHTQEAESAFRTAVSQFERLSNDFPDVLEYRYAHALARRHLNLGILLTRARLEADAEGHYSRAYSLLEDVLARSPADDALRLDLITAHTNRAALMRHLGRPRDEEWSWRRVAELQE